MKLLSSKGAILVKLCADSVMSVTNHGKRVVNSKKSIIEARSP